MTLIKVFFIVLCLIPFQSYASNCWYVKHIGIKISNNNSQDKTICHTKYDVIYNINLHIPVVVTYQITPKMLRSNRKKHRRDFTIDPKINEHSSLLDAYLHSGYDMGHLAPAASFYYSKRINQQTYYHTNIAPQLPHFNRGVWRSLETNIRKYVIKHNKTVTVITGAIYSKTDKSLKSVNGEIIDIPSKFYKIIVIGCIPYSFLIDQKGSSTSKLATYMVSVDDIEQLTHLDFFAGELKDETIKYKYPF